LSSHLKCKPSFAFFLKLWMSAHQRVSFFPDFPSFYRDKGSVGSPPPLFQVERCKTFSPYFSPSETSEAFHPNLSKKLWMIKFSLQVCHGSIKSPPQKEFRRSPSFPSEGAVCPGPMFSCVFFWSTPVGAKNPSLLLPLARPVENFPTFFFGNDFHEPGRASHKSWAD